jgi:hypothetical protein
MDRGALKLLALATSYSLVVLLLVALRLAGEITWSWIWVLSPLWVPAILMGISFAVLLAMLGRVNDVP